MRYRQISGAHLRRYGREKMNLKQNLAVMMLALAMPAMIFAQANSSALSGVVRDPSAAVITGAAITVTNSETGLTRTRESDPAGRYRVGELPPGTYQITVSMAGFNRETRKDLVLQVGQELGLSFTLQIGALEQEIVVTSEAPVVETTTASVARVVSQEQLRELPLNGRSFTDLITLDTMASTPGNQAKGTANYGNSAQLTVAGARSDSNSFTLDGTDINGTANGSPGSAAGVQLGVDTIREFQVITANAKAEYGRNSGAIVNAVTRSGTNDMHGTLFEFLRNKTLDARRFIDLPTAQNPNGSLPPFKRNQFGGSLGGRIKQDKSFYFLAYEGLRQRLTETQVYRVPTADGRRGIGAGVLNTVTNTRPDVVVHPSIVPYVNLWPSPSLGSRSYGDGTADYFGPVVQPTNENFGSARFDHTYSEKDFLFARYTTSRGDSVIPSQLLSDSSFLSANQFITAQYDRIISSTMLNMFRAGFNRSFNDISPGQAPGGENLGFTPGQPIGSLGPTPLSTLGPAGIVRLYQVQNSFQFDDNLTINRGAHTWKFGTAVQRFQWNSDQPAFVQGSITFNSFTNFLLAGPTGTGATFLLPESSTYRHIRTTMYGFYGQDDWRVSPRLTINYGLRWEFTTGLKETDDLVSYILDPQTSRLEDVKVGELWDNKIKNFQPRLGLNWSLDEESKTVLSGGLGIFHNQVLHNSMVSFRAQQPFYFRGSFAGINSVGVFPNVRAMIATTANGADQPTAAAFRVTRTFDHDNFKTPTYYRYNMTIQRALPGQLVARVGYVGSFSRHLARRQGLNTFPQPIKQADGSLFFPCATASAVCSTPAPQFINPNFSQIEWMSSDANSSYNALTANLQQKFRNGMSFQASYTYSKCIDDASSSETNYSTAATLGQWSPDRTLERARCNFNIPHAFVANGLYELPFGSGRSFMNSGGVADWVLGNWQIGGVLTIQQGLPFTVTTNFRAPGFTGFAANRPNTSPNADATKATQEPFGTREQFFDTSIFSNPAGGTLGTAGRNYLLGAPLVQLNFTLSKSFSISEQTKLQFRSEYFNALNQTNLSFPATNINVAGAGRITDTSTKARQIQLALKLTF
ncbi:MAG: TonB-dependent receptor [Acidobacteria bacterium]|nr:TonB-dependent receptor [Acidobacteriota bacterium]